MSEEVKLAANIAKVYTERQALLDQLHAAEQERNAAIERERIAVEAYNQQQSSYRELEALYQAMTERVIRAERWAKIWKQGAYFEWTAFRSADCAATRECEKAMQAEAEIDDARVIIVATANDLTDARYERDQLELLLSAREAEINRLRAIAGERAEM